ncbi:MAG: TolC family protein [Bryobacteraceae bacterium]|nr:TolC family protein [Bryobacteraceae bacterium]
MLKVTVHDSAGALRIQIEGKLTAPWVTELENCWRTAQSTAAGKQVIADLVDVDYADLAGRYLLAWMFASGVRFISRTLPMQALITEITGQAPEVPAMPDRPCGLRRLGMLFALLSIPLGAQPLTLTLRKAVEIANSAEGSPRLQIADESVKQAEARSKQQRASLLPNVDGSLTYQDQTRNLAAFGLNIQLPVPGFSIPTFVGPFSTVDARANASQSVFDLATIQRYRASKVAIAGAKAERNNTADQVTATVARAWVTALKADADVDTAKANITLAQAVLKQVQDQKAAGTGVGIEVTRAKVQLANEQQRLLVATSNRRKAQLNLLRAVGLKLDTDVVLEEKLAYQPVPELTYQQAAQKAFLQRADLKAQSERQRSTELSANAVKWERLPSVTAFGDYGAIGTSVDNARATRTAGIQVRIPLWDGGRRDARRAEIASLFREQETRTRDLRQQVELEVRLALDSLQSAAEQVQVAGEGLKLSEDELASARRRYAAGVSTSVEITDAQTRLERARDNHVAALYAWNIARIDLAQSQGTIEEVIP